MFAYVYLDIHYNIHLYIRITASDANLNRILSNIQFKYQCMYFSNLKWGPNSTII